MSPEDTTYSYSPLGEETDRTTTGGATKARGSNYDPAGHTAAVDDRSAPTAADVDYAYDGSDNLISRKESAGGAGPKTRLYFYWGMGTTLAEETDGQGATLARYLVDGSDTVAQETYRAAADGHRDPTDTAGTWTWLLDDTSGNVATYVGDDGAVTKQVAFDPYGRPEKGGTGKTPTAPGSSLGFQGAHTDPTTGSVILGPRQYDPTTGRFTSPDAYAATTTYTLDDGANVTQQTTTVGSETRSNETSTYPNGRLATRHTTGAGSTPTEDTIYGYSPLGEEKDRTTTGGAAKDRGTNYDPAGHTAAVDDRSAPTAADVDYAHDGSDNLISRKESPGGVGAKTRLYFYWGMGTTLAEETDGQGATLARCLVEGGDTMAQETYRVGADGHRDPTDTAGTWTWLLDEPLGQRGHPSGDDGAVTKQAFDPYGRPEKGGTGKSPSAPGSSLGFQGAHTDPTTGSVILGPRQYDPTTARFTSPDVYAAGDLDLSLGTDELTGNRYLFAAANPVAYYEDGHKPGWCKTFWNCQKDDRAWVEKKACFLDVGTIPCALAWNYGEWAKKMARKYGREIPGEIKIAIQHTLGSGVYDVGSSYRRGRGTQTIGSARVC